MLPFILTFIGVAFRAVLDALVGGATGGSIAFGTAIVNVIAIGLTAVGVLITLCRRSSWKEKLISLAIHAVIWIVGYFLVGLLVPVCIVLVIAFVVLTRMGILNLGQFTQTPVQQNPNGVDAMPEIIYDMNNNRWILQHRDNGYATYRSDNGQEFTIMHADVNGSSAQTQYGNFHWY